MKIEEAKLDFDDVLIRPKRSALVSRKDVDIIREFKLPNGNTISGFPLIVANMDTTGTFAMNESLSKHHAFTALHKYYPIEDIKKHWKNNYGFLTFGMSEKDNERINQLEEVINELANPKICLDVANGYTEKFCNYVSKFRERFPNATIMAGNVCTPEMTEQLILSGASIVKVGVGPGCFVAGTMVTTKGGLKPIEKIKVGDVVLTHTGEYKEVTATMSRKENEVIISINGIECTKNHEFYVVKRSDANKITEENIHEYATWVSAEELSEEYLLIKTS